MHVHRHPVLPPQPLGEADVVRVAVREDDAADLIDAPPHRLQLGEQVAPVAGEAGVDDGDALIRVDEVGRDDVVADAVQVRSEFHDGYDT